MKYERTFAAHKHNSHLVTFDDGKKYVVKCYDTTKPKALINEWLAYQIAKYMHLPVPHARLVSLPHTLLPIPDKTTVIKMKTQFASAYIEGKNAHEIAIENMKNTSQLASVIVFDYWLYNRDRTRKNVIIEQNGTDQTLWIIDHADICGSFAWTVERLKQLPQTPIDSKMHRIMASFTTIQQFEQAIAVIQTMPTLLIEEMMKHMPEDWPMTEEEKKQLVHTLVYRRDHLVPRLIRKFCKQLWPELI
ncbi:HipA family kinase [Anoxybacillus sp. TBDG-1]